MKVIMPDGTSMEEFLKEWDEELKKKNLRNWVNNKFPHGIGNYSTYYMLTHPWEIIKFWAEEIKYAWQRVFRGWDDRVVWAVSTHLIKFMPEWIKIIKETKDGIPISVFENEDIDFNTGNVTKSGSKRAQEKWNSILDEILIGFEAAKRLDESDYDFKKEDFKEIIEEDRQKFNRAFKLLADYFFNLGS